MIDKSDLKFDALMLFKNDKKVVIYISHKQHNISLIPNHSANTIRLNDQITLVRLAYFCTLASPTKSKNIYCMRNIKIKHVTPTFIKYLL